MSGTRNHSGRYPKGWKDWDIDKLVNHSVKLVAKLLDDPDIDKGKKLEVAASFARKVIPEQTFVEHKHSISHEDRLLLRDRLRSAGVDIKRVDAEVVNDGPYGTPKELPPTSE